MFLLTGVALASSVVAAAHPLAPGQVVSVDDVYLAEMPPDLIPPNALTSLEQVVGRTPIEPILADEFLRTERFADEASGAGVEVLVPRGLRMVRLALPEPIFLQPGNYIDVVAVREGRACAVAQALLVVQVESRDGALSTAPDFQGGAAVLHVVVSPEQAGVLGGLKPESLDVLIRSPIDVQNVASVQCGSQAPGRVVVNVAEPVRVAPSSIASARPLLRGRNAFVGELWVEPGASIPVHRDATEEFLVVLAGEGVLTLDGTAQPLRQGMSVYMPARAEVSFVNGATRFHALQVFAGPAPASKYNGWPVAPQAR